MKTELKNFRQRFNLSQTEVSAYLNILGALAPFYYYSFITVKRKGII